MPTANSLTTSYQYNAQPGSLPVFSVLMLFSPFLSGNLNHIKHHERRTQRVTAYQLKWTDTSDIYLLDTPGFDDTNRSDTEVLIEIAACLIKTYEDNIKLSGILYLHRITDRRIGGSARRNLMMFRKLCGKDSLKNVILVTTMWEDEQPATGAKREQELISTNGFWGALVEEGAQINRHDNTRGSAMALLKMIARNNRVTVSIQKEMVSEHKDLNETEAGIGLNSDILLAEQRVKKEMAEALEMERQARRDHDEKSAEEQRQYREKMQEKFDHLNQERENLKISLEEMKEQRRLFTELQEKYQDSQRRMRQQDERIETLEEQRQLQEKQMLQRTKEAGRALQNLRLQLDARDDEKPTTSSMRPRASLTQYERDHERLSLSLAGKYWFFNGRNRNSWQVRIRTIGWSDSLATEYPKLVKWLDKCRDLGCPDHISLGVNGYYFITMRSGKVDWQVPSSVASSITDYTGERNMESVSRLWLGYEHDYVAEIDEDDYIYQVYNYGGLSGHLDDIDGEGETIKQLAMNIEDPRGYILVKDGGASFANPGSADTGFSEESWQRFRDCNKRDWKFKQAPKGFLLSYYKTCASCARWWYVCDDARLHHPVDRDLVEEHL
ncbi:hypothetical protein F66182_4169 [Fusarium sp. NRRL 66182]|nr:hypothetical protein F66182_4169 [Fusarium sp. NRRL 66182]